MQPVIFVLSSSPCNPSAVTRCMQFARLSGQSGMPTTVFLVDDAVYNATTQLNAAKAVTGDDAFTHYAAILEGKMPVQFLVCKPCCAARGIGQEDFLPGFAFGSGPDLIDLIAQPGAKVLTF